MKITGFHKAMAMVIGVMTLGLLEQHDVTNNADFLTGVGAGLLGVLFGALLVDMLND